MDNVNNIPGARNKGFSDQKEYTKISAKTGEKSGSRCEGPSGARTVAGERSTKLIFGPSPLVRGFDQRYI